MNRFPAYEHGCDEEQGREAEQPHAQAVEADAEADIDGRAAPGEPGGVGEGEISGIAGGRIAEDELPRAEQREKGDKQGGRAGHMATGGRDEPKAEGTGERKEDRQ